MSDALFWTSCVWLLVGVFVTRWGLRKDRRDRLHGKKGRRRLYRLLHRGVRAARQDERTIEALLAERRN